MQIGAPTVSAAQLRAGDQVEIKSIEEILATLDERGTVDGLPFMPEMLKHCGARVGVYKRADKTCDTINYSGSRRMHDTVHLEGLRCDGAAHGGCQAGCLMYWKECWLKRVDRDAKAGRPHEVRPSSGDVSADTRSALDRLAQHTQQPPAPDSGEVRYRCQATELLRASAPLRWWDLRQYWRDIRSRNVTASALVRATLFRLFLKLLRVGGYRALLWSYNRLQTWRGGTPFPYLKGNLARTPLVRTDLQPGELVQVRSQQEILGTVDSRNRNRGLSFDPEMVRYCGKSHRVLARVERIIDEGSGKMLQMSSDCIILEGVTCRSEYSDKRLFCPRSLYPFWREIWLQRVEPKPPQVSDQATFARTGADIPEPAKEKESL